MIHKYRKTALIEAEQFDGSDEMAEKYSIYPDSGFVTSKDWANWFVLPTKEGDMILNKGDWIATGVEGEHWVIADDIFRKTYERCD